MNKISKINVQLLPSGRSIQVSAGTTVLQAIRRAGVSLPVRCDGRAACLMCKVHIQPGEQGTGDGLCAPNAAEQRKLGSQLQEGIRLGCQARIEAPAVITVPEDRLKAAIRRQLEQQDDDLSDW
ncbi:2Fe-2S iron-sulfur cluster-binding protein [Paenibacillus sp. WLX2291]|uniref:2Fe-2S iron-sulfur cluster-binding protein n=1 Tax=Paenibacillus sp. WLX2291 TaxID=3296934 RepID=UPI003983EC18